MALSADLRPTVHHRGQLIAVLAAPADRDKLARFDRVVLSDTAHPVALADCTAVEVGRTDSVVA